MDARIAPLQVKAAGPDDGLAEGQFEGYASVFGNVDSYGDIVERGAFAGTLADWAAKGDPIPLLWGHDMGDPFSNVGGIDSAEEDEYGLKVRGTFDLDNPKAMQVYRLAKGRRVTGMSFAYSVRKAKSESDGQHLLDLDLYEVSIVPLGANPEAGVSIVKSTAHALAKAGRVLSSKNEKAIREARDALDAVLSSLGEQDGTDQEKASDPPQAKATVPAEEPPGANVGADAEEPKAGPSVDYLAAITSMCEADVTSAGEES